MLSTACRYASTMHNDNFLNGTSSIYAEKMYDQWKQDPQSVSTSWRAYFQNLESGAEVPFEQPPNIGMNPQIDMIIKLLTQNGFNVPQTGPTTTKAETVKQVNEAYRLMMLIRAFMTHGHLLAKTDPLELYETYKMFDTYAQKFKIPKASVRNQLDPKRYGFTDKDLDREFYIDAPELAGLLRRQKKWKLRDLLDSLDKAYCGKIGVEYMHIQDRD